MKKLLLFSVLLFGAHTCAAADAGIEPGTQVLQKALKDLKTAIANTKLVLTERLELLKKLQQTSSEAKAAKEKLDQNKQSLTTQLTEGAISYYNDLAASISSLTAPLTSLLNSSKDSVANLKQIDLELQGTNKGIGQLSDLATSTPGVMHATTPQTKGSRQTNRSLAV